MNLNNPAEMREFFEIMATGYNCVITRFDAERHIVEFNGADKDMEELARALAEKFPE